MNGSWEKYRNKNTDKCWFCQKPGCDAFDTEFDTFLHLDCLRKELELCAIDPSRQSEAPIMAYLLGDPGPLLEEELINNAEMQLSEEIAALNREIEALRDRVGKLWNWVLDHVEAEPELYWEIEVMMKELGLDAVSLSKRE